MAQKVGFSLGWLTCYISEYSTMLLRWLLTYMASNYLILLHRPTHLGGKPPQSDSDQKIAFNAATKITRMVEDLLSAGTLRFAQLHLYVSCESQSYNGLTI